MWGSKARKRLKAAEDLFQAAVAASRAPDLYGAGRVPDTIDGRFEMLALHTGAAMIRLKREDREFARVFAERVVQGLEESLRELGVGDMSVPRKLKRMAESLYGRVFAYEAGLADPEPAALTQAIARNVWDADAAPFAAALADRFRTLVRRLEGCGVENLATAEAWAAKAET